MNDKTDFSLTIFFNILHLNFNKLTSWHIEVSFLTKIVGEKWSPKYYPHLIQINPEFVTFTIVSVFCRVQLYLSGCVSCVREVLELQVKSAAADSCSLLRAFSYCRYLSILLLYINKCISPSNNFVLLNILWQQ